MSIVRGADGKRVRVSKRSGVAIPTPESLLKARVANRPAEPGVKDTPAAAAARVTYAPAPELVPYLAADGKLWERAGGKGKEPALPKLLRGSGLRRRNRKKVRGKWELSVERDKLVRGVEAMTAALKKEAAGVRREGGGLAPSPGPQQEATTELR